MRALPAAPPIEGTADVLRSSIPYTLDSFVERVEQRVQQYLTLRTDNDEQADHLRHVADRLQGDLPACCFHDADISDMLFIGSLERRPNREDIFHTGGLLKILMIHLTNRIHDVPSAPADLAGCIRSCQGTVASACKEFMTPTAVEHGNPWRRAARRILTLLQEKNVYERMNTALVDRQHAPLDRLTTVRSLTRLHAREFLNRPDEE